MDTVIEVSPSHSGTTGERKARMAWLDKETCGACHERARRQPHRKGATHPCNLEPRVIRRSKQGTHRQMDNVWLADMTTDTLWTNEDWLDYYTKTQTLRGVVVESGDARYYERLLATNGIDEGFADRHWSGYPTIDDHNRETVAEDRDWYDDMQWRWGQYDFQMTEGQQSCHGFNGDPWEETLWLNPNHGRLYPGDNYDFWGVEEVYPDDYPPEWDKYEEWTDRYEFGTLTPEDQAYLDAEAAAEEAENEARLDGLTIAQHGGPRGRRAVLFNSARERY